MEWAYSGSEILEQEDQTQICIHISWGHIKRAAQAQTQTYRMGHFRYENQGAVILPKCCPARCDLADHSSPNPPIFADEKTEIQKRGLTCLCLHSQGVAEGLTSSIWCLLWLWQGQNLKHSLEMGQQKADYLSTSPLKIRAGLEGGEALGLI